MEYHQVVALIEEKLKVLNVQNMQDIARIVNDALGKDPTRYVDVARVPLLCKSVIDMRESITEIKDMMKEDRISDERIHNNFVTKDGQYFVVRAIVFVGTGTILVWALKLVFESLTK